MTVQRGKRIGRYEILTELGRGGMSRVYRARDLQLQRIVALKVLAPALSADSEYVARFEREARVAAQLRHPNIVTIYDVGSDDHLHYIAMEYIAGRSVAVLLEQFGALAPQLVLTVLAATADALDTAHRAGAVHRDVKPHNILIDRNGRVVLTDFGIAQTADGDHQRLTRTGVFMGTPEYLSPEQAEARRVDGRSDLYGLAVVAYEMLSGRVPFQGATTQLLVAHVQSLPPPITSLAPQLPAAVDAVISRGLAKSPDDRFQSGAAFVEALSAALREASITPADTAELAEFVRATASQTEQVETDHPPRVRDSAAGAEPTRSPVHPAASRPQPSPVQPAGDNGENRRKTGAQPVRPPEPVRPSGRDSQAVLYMLGALLAVIGVALVTLTVRALFVGGGTAPTAAPTDAVAVTEGPANPTIIVPSAAATMRPTRTLFPSFTPSPSSTAATGTPTAGRTATRTAAATAPAVIASPTLGVTPSASATTTATASPTLTITATPTVSATVTATPTGSPTASATPSATASPTASATPSATASPTPSATPSLTPSPTAEVTIEPTLTPTPAP